MKTAIITGASTGVGLEFVKQIKDVFPEITEYWVIARRMDRLEAISVPGITIKPLPLDLTSEEAITSLQAELAIANPTVSLLVGNAGCGYLGNFDESPLDEQLRMLDLNIWALTAVTRVVLWYRKRFDRCKSSAISGASCGVYKQRLFPAWYKVTCEESSEYGFSDRYWFRCRFGVQRINDLCYVVRNGSRRYGIRRILQNEFAL